MHGVPIKCSKAASVYSADRCAMHACVCGWGGGAGGGGGGHPYCFCCKKQVLAQSKGIKRLIIMLI